MYVASTTGFVDVGPANLVALTEGIHSKEALELIREHMLGMMGAGASTKFSTEVIKMSKFQMAQVSDVCVTFLYIDWIMLFLYKILSMCACMCCKTANSADTYHKKKLGC